MVPLPPLDVIIEGLSLPECPRWHNGTLYFSDITAGRIFRLGDDDKAELIHEEPNDFIGGIGFLENGDILAVLTKQRKLLRISEGGSSVQADLTELCRFVLNDMSTFENRSYVSQPGFDVWGDGVHGMPDPTDLLLVQPDGSASIAASGMMSPNGMAISPDGNTLYVAECTAMRITCFDIDSTSGMLSNRRLFGALPDGGIPDGICLDDQGAVWSAVPVAVAGASLKAGPGVIRMTEGGTVTHVVPVAAGRRALACTLGGEKSEYLYICTVPDFEGVSASSAGQGQIERVKIV